MQFEIEIKTFLFEVVSSILWVLCENIKWLLNILLLELWGQVGYFVGYLLKWLSGKKFIQKWSHLGIDIGLDWAAMIDHCHQFLLVKFIGY